MTIIPKTKKGKIGLLIAAIVVLVLVTRMFGAKEDITGPTGQSAAVSLVRVADLADEAARIRAVGLVDSLQSADVRAQTTGQVTAVYRHVGDYVSAGTILATLENADLYAQLSQAQAGADLQSARLEELLSGPRTQEISISESGVANAKIAKEEAVRSLVNAIRDAYVKSDDSIRNKLDIIFDNPSTPNPQIKTAYIVGGQLEIDIERQRQEMNFLFADWEKMLTTLSTSSDLDSLVIVVRGYLDQVHDLLDDSAVAINALTPNQSLSQAQIDGLKLNVSTARTTISGTMTALSQSVSALNAARTGYDQAVKQLDLLQEGATTEQTKAQEAQLAQAKAGVAAAQAQIAKTILRAPVSGELVSFSLSIGDYVSPSQLVAHVVSSGALEIKTQLSSDVARRVSVGDQVEIDGIGAGVVTRVAGGIDPETGKVHVSIEPQAEDVSKLTIGEYVDVVIHAKGTTSGQTIQLPFSAIKVESRGSFVYVVDELGVVRSVPIKTGKTTGISVEVTGGLEDVDRVISSVRGLSVGDLVEIE